MIMFMKEILLTLLIGLIAGIVDVMPMIKMKLDKYAISSAFIFYFIMPIIVFNINLLNNLWWIKGGLVVFILAIPVIIIVSKADKKSVLPMSLTSIILGTCIGIAGHILGIY